MPTISRTPPALSPHATSVRQLDGRWFIAETFSRHEKAAAFGLMDNAIGFYLPMIVKTVRLAGKRRKLTVPLFPGCVFANCRGDDEWYTVREHPSVYRMLAVGNQSGLVNDLERLENAIRAGIQIDPYDFATPGARCLVKSGPFQGYECDVVRRDDIDHAVIELAWIGGRKFTIPMEASDLSPLN
jgi:transcription antitermination factor NusG